MFIITVLLFKKIKEKIILSESGFTEILGFSGLVHWFYPVNPLTSESEFPEF